MKHDQPNVKLCECGCGQPAPIATKTNSKWGHVKGEPKRFVAGHNARVFSEETRAKMSDAKRGRPVAEVTLRAAIAANSGRRLSDAHRRKVSLGLGGTGDAVYTAIHNTLAQRYPKARVCEECGAAGPTDYAFRRHPEPHTDERADYRELCRTCHRRFDRALKRRLRAEPQP